MKDKDFDNTKRLVGIQPRKGRLILTNLTKAQRTLIKTGAIASSGITLNSILSEEVLSNIITRGYNNAEDAKNDIRDEMGFHQSLGEKTSINIEAYFADNVNDTMSLQEAFGTARGEMGHGAFFEWRDNIYNTFYKEEWESLPVGRREEYWNSVVENADYNSLEVIKNEEDILIQDSNTENLEDQNLAKRVGDLNDLDKDVIPEALEQDLNYEDLTDVIIAELDYDGRPGDSNSDWEKEDNNLDIIVIEEDPLEISKTEINIDGDFNINDFLEIDDDDNDDNDPHIPKNDDPNIDSLDEDEDEDLFDTT